MDMYDVACKRCPSPPSQQGRRHTQFTLVSWIGGPSATATQSCGLPIAKMYGCGVHACRLTHHDMSHADWALIFRRRIAAANQYNKLQTRERPRDAGDDEIVIFRAPKTVNTRVTTAAVEDHAPSPTFPPIARRVLQT